MASVVDDEKREVMFLYNLKIGPCPRSYGLHVANMACTYFIYFITKSYFQFAAIPEEIIEEAQNIATTLHAAILRKLTKRIVEASKGGNFDQLVGLWRAAKGRWLSWSET